MQLLDAEGNRVIRIETGVDPTRLFISGGHDFCVEMDRGAFVLAIAEEFGLAPLAMRELWVVA